MPVYDYLCESCGPFTLLRPMAECDLPYDCPECGASAPRAFLTAPYCSGMSSERRTIHAVNERSANAPKSLAEYKASHGPGCGCCSDRASRMVAKGKNGTKAFPTSRPWMISH